MKHLFIILLGLVTLFFSACGSKIPFTQQQPVKNAALVYIYMVPTQNDGIEIEYNAFNVRFNGKRVQGKISPNEYMAYNLKPTQTKISVVKNQIEEFALDVVLKNQEVYYLKITDNLDGGKFNLQVVQKNEALKDLAKTGLAGSSIEGSDYIVDALVSKPKKESNTITKTPTSKVERIQKAYEMKDKGILTENEFVKLKTEILSK